MRHKLVLLGAVALFVLCLVGIFLRESEQRNESSDVSRRTVPSGSALKAPGAEIPLPEPVVSAAAETAPVTEITPETVSDEVLKITDDSGRLDPRDRVVLLSKLSSRLNKADRSRLYGYLINGENNSWTDQIKNDILNVLRRQEPPPAELTQVMLDLFRDENQSIVMRSYALQHMEPWYSEENMRDEAVKDAFYTALEERNELAGVALLALASLSEQLPDEFDRNFIAEKAAAIAADGQNSELSRITALDVSSRLGASSALEAARKVIREKSGNTMMNSVAFGIIGRAGDSSDLPMIAEALESGLAGKRAAQLAAGKLKKQSFQENNQ